MFETLNDDCILHIINFLDFKDQINFAKISKNIRNNVLYAWSREKKHVLPNAVLQDVDLQDFLASCHTNTDELAVIYDTVNELKLWLPYQFNNVKTLECHIDDIRNGDQCIQILQQVFPALNTLKLQCQASGMDIWRWTELRELDLSYCQSISPNMYEQLFREVKLQRICFPKHTFPESIIITINKCLTLEEIQIDGYCLTYPLVQCLKELRNLRVLKVSIPGLQTNFLNIIQSCMEALVHSITFDDASWLCNIEDIGIFKNLRQLFLIEEDVDSEMLCECLSSLPVIEEVHAINSFVWQKASELMELMVKCPSLKFINLNNFLMYENFFDMNSSDIKNTMDQRKSSITLNFFRSNQEYSTILSYFSHPKIQITFDEHNGEISENPYVTIKFVQLTN